MNGNRIEELVHACLQGEASEAELEELLGLLGSGDEAARRAASTLADAAMIAGWFRAESDERFVREALAAVGKERDATAFVRRTLQRISQTPSRRHLGRRGPPAAGPFVFLAAAAAVVLAAAGILLVVPSRRPGKGPAEKGGPEPPAAEADRPLPEDLLEVERREAMAELDRLRRERQRQEEELAGIAREREDLFRRRLVEEAEARRQAEEERRRRLERLQQEERRVQERIVRAEGPRTTTREKAPLLLAASVERSQGEAFVVGEEGRSAARPGEPVYGGQGLETVGPKSSLVAVFADGTRLELGPDTSVIDLGEREGTRGKTLRLDRGTVTAQVARQPAGTPMVILTEYAEVTVLGTRLTLSVSGGMVRLDVREGRARLSRRPSGPSVEVPAGFFAVTGAGQDPELRHEKAVRLAFQDGVSPWPKYAGTRDCHFGEHKQEADRNNGTGAQVWVDGDCRPPQGDDRYALLRWDLSAIPPGSTVLSASISIQVVNNPNGQPFHLFEMRRDWVENQATWNQSASKRPWQIPGARGPQDRGNVLLGSLAPRVNGPYTTPLNAAGVAVVQSWVDNPNSNFGFWLGNPDNGDALGFESREAPGPANRPLLTVVFVPRGR